MRTISFTDFLPTNRRDWKGIGNESALADVFTYFRSVFMWYMWRVEEVDTAVLE